MVAIARALSRASGTDIDVETLKTLVLFCGVGLFASLLLAGLGVDLPLDPHIDELNIMNWI
jgi:hypothetical protein